MTESALKNPVPEPLHCGEINGHRFYVAAMFGKLTGLNETREDLRAGNLIAAARSLVDSDTLDVETRIRIRTIDDTGRSDIHAVAGAIALTDTDPPRLEAAAINPESVLDFLSIGLDVARVGWRENEEVERGMARTIEIDDIHDTPIPAVLDGEAVELPSHASAHLIYEAARVLRANPPA